MINEDLSSTYNWEEPKWKYKLRAAGYDGELELGAMIRSCPLETSDHYQFTLIYGLLYAGLWSAGYLNNDGPLLLNKEGNTPEEAVAEFWIANCSQKTKAEAAK